MLILIGLGPSLLSFPLVSWFLNCSYIDSNLSGCATNDLTTTLSLLLIVFFTLRSERIRRLPTSLRSDFVAQTGSSFLSRRTPSSRSPPSRHRERSQLLKYRHGAWKILSLHHFAKRRHRSWTIQNAKQIPTTLRLNNDMTNIARAAKGMGRTLANIPLHSITYL